MNKKEIEKLKKNMPKETLAHLTIAEQVLKLLNESKLNPKQVYLMLKSFVRDAELKYFNNEEGKMFIASVDAQIKLAEKLSGKRILEDKKIEGIPKYIG